MAERYREVQIDTQRAANPILRSDVEMVSLPRVAMPLPVDPPKVDKRPSRRPPPVPTVPSLPPLPSRSAGPNTTSSVWDDSEFDE
jgi:hypothetical protein